jgi:hypothetical protein
MDYARFNYVAQPEDRWLLYSLELETMTSGLLNGDILTLKTTKDEAQEKHCWTEMEAYKNNRLWFGSESSPYDPRYQTET